jgi:hypothetical protein
MSPPWYSFSNDGRPLGANLDGIARPDSMIDL